MDLSTAVRAYLSAPRFGVLATLNPDGSAQQTVMWYLLDGDAIVLNTRYGRQKADNLRHDVRVSICVPDGYRFVTVHGRASLVEDEAVAQADIRRLAVRYHGEVEGTRQADEEFSRQRRITIRVPIEHVIAYGVGA